MQNILNDFQFVPDGTTTLVDALCRFIKEGITFGRIKGGEKLPTIGEICKATGLTFAQARRVTECLAREGYVSSRPHVGTIVLSPIASFSRDANDDLAVLKSELLRATNLVIAVRATPQVQKVLAESGVRHFFVYGDKPESDDHPWIRFAPEEAFTQFADHCCRAGVKNVVQVRFEGVEMLDAQPVLAKRGIDCSWMNISRGKAGWGRFDGIVHCGYEAFAAIPRSNLPELLLFWNSFFTQGAIMAFLANGIKIPEDVKIVALSNTGVGPVYITPFTRFEIDSADAGQKIGDFALDVLAKKHKPNIKLLEMSPELMADLKTKFGFAPTYEKPSMSETTSVNLIWTQVQPSAMYGRIGANAANFHRIDLNCAPERESMAEVLASSQGMYLVFSTESEEIALKCKMTCEAPKVAILGLDKYGVWNVMQVEVGSCGDEHLFTAKNDREYVKFQVCFPQSTISEIQVGATDIVEFENPGKCDIVFVGSGIAQNACNSIHMNICPYLYRKFGLNCAEASISGFHTFMCSELVDVLAKKSVPTIVMDVFNLDNETYAKGKMKMKNLVPCVVYLDDSRVDEIIHENRLGVNDLVVLPAECMFDSRHLNDYGTMFYCDKLVEREFMPGGTNR